MAVVDLLQNKTSYTLQIVEALAKTGWRAIVTPAKGKLRSNRQLVEFRTPNAQLKVRFSVFAVGDRGESHRRDERRIQITTTYLSGLERLKDFTDIVLGYDSKNGVYVGLDPQRLNFGGKQHNASSSVDPMALEHTPTNTILIRPHDTQILGLEYQAIFHPSRLAEYVFNVDSIHRGLYVGKGVFSEPKTVVGGHVDALTVLPENSHGEVLTLEISKVSRSPRRVTKSRVTAYENGNWEVLKDLSPDELEAIRRKCVEVGDRGEYFVFRFEKQRLRKAGQHVLANKVDWISRRSVGKGYDIRSFEVDGSPRFIEVKATNGFGMTFPMSGNEWRTAVREKDAYHIYRIVDVDKVPTLARIVRNPVNAEKELTLEKVAAGWRVMLK